MGFLEDIIGRGQAQQQYPMIGADPLALALAGQGGMAGGYNPFACGGVQYDPAALAYFAAMRASRNMFQVESACPTASRRELLGFPRTVIAAGDTDTISTQPQVISKIFRITIPSDIAFQLLIHDFKIGKWSLLANNDPVPAAMLDELATEVDIDPQAAQVNTVISAELENTSNADVDVRMGCIVLAWE